MKRTSIKSFISGVLCTVLTLSFAFTVLAATTKSIDILPGINISIDGKEFVPTDVNGNIVEVFSYNGTTYVPLRAVSQAFGKKVGWEGQTKTAIIETPEELRTIYMTRTGKKYHFDGTCNGGDYFETTLAQALKIGLEPCDKCIH